MSLHKVLLFFLVVASLGFLALFPVQAQFIQQGEKLVGTGAVGIAQQGHSVALSADGSTAIGGGYGDNAGAGAAWVFTRTDGVWSQQGNKLVGTGAVGSALQGYSVALSADGNTAIVGGYNDNGYTGAAWVFTRTNGVWSQQGNKLVGTGAVGIAQQGYSVALSADGNTAIVGGYNDNDYTGAAWVFVQNSVGFGEQALEIPRQFGLKQNYPNPFNPSTTIKYELPKSSLVTLTVYDLLGREVSVLVNERRDAGVHETKFDGAGLASGVYFYRLTAGSFVQTRKLLLMK